MYFRQNLKTRYKTFNILSSSSASHSLSSQACGYRSNRESSLHTATVLWQPDCVSTRMKCPVAVSIKWWCLSSVFVHGNNGSHRRVSKRAFQPFLSVLPFDWHLQKLARIRFVVLFVCLFSIKIHTTYAWR